MQEQPTYRVQYVEGGIAVVVELPEQLTNMDNIEIDVQLSSACISCALFQLRVPFNAEVMHSAAEAKLSRKRHQLTIRVPCKEVKTQANALELPAAPPMPTSIASNGSTSPVGNDMASRIQALRLSVAEDVQANTDHTELMYRLDSLSSGNNDLSQRIADARISAAAVDSQLSAFQETIIQANPSIEEQAIELHMDMGLLRKQMAVYNALYEGLDTNVAKKISSNEREKQGLAHSSLVYGEISFEPFAITIRKIEEKFGGLPREAAFYDIGSGTGKPVFAAVLLHDGFKTASGVEILKGLHATSEEVLRKWQRVVGDLDQQMQHSEKGAKVVAKDDIVQEVVAKDDKVQEGDEIKHQQLLSLCSSLGPHSAQLSSPEVTMVCADCTDLNPLSGLDWSGGDLVFANSTCFDHQLLHDVAACAERMHEVRRCTSCKARAAACCMRRCYTVAIFDCISDFISLSSSHYRGLSSSRSPSHYRRTASQSSTKGTTR
jgi:hypothetical protein